MNWLRILCFLVLSGTCLTANAQERLQITLVDSLTSYQAQEARKVVVFIHTDWCKYCELMQQSTFTNKALIKRLNAEFYFISFNAEQKESASYLGKRYQYKATGYGTGVHQLVQALIGDNAISYPCLLIYDEKNELIRSYFSYLSANTLLQLLP